MRVAFSTGFTKIVVTQLLFLLGIPGVIAQTKHVTHEHQQWIQYNNLVRFGDKWSFQSAAGYRWRDGFREPAQYILRTGAQFQVSKVIQLTSGFGVNGAYALGKINRMEYRPYQDLLIRNRLGKIELNHRYRMEQRFFQFLSKSKVQDNTNFIFRLRYALNLNIPVITFSGDDHIEEYFLMLPTKYFLMLEKISSIIFLIRTGSPWDLLFK